MDIPNSIEGNELPRPTEPSETLVSSPQEAKNIARLTDRITIDNPVMSHPQRDKYPYISIFANQWVPESSLWVSIIQKGPLEREKLEAIGALFDDSKVVESIREVNRTMKDRIPPGNITGFSFQSATIAPLIEGLLGSPREGWENVVSEWKQEWSGKMNPDKFRKVMEVVFARVSRTGKAFQEVFLAHVEDELARGEEADSLADLFQHIEDENSDPLLIQQADIKNRGLISNDAPLPKEALYHTTGLETLPQIMDMGILSPEAVALAQDGYREAHFGVSFHAYNEPPASIADFAKDIKSGNDTSRVIDDRVHLAFLSPSEYTESSNLLYPPYSYWFNRLDKAANTANRYICGFDDAYDPSARRSVAYALIGLPSTALSFVVLDRSLSDKYKEQAANFPFYVPAYSYEGELLFTPDEYDKLRTSGKNNNRHMSASIDAQPSREPVVAPELSSILPAAEDLARLRAEVEGKIVDDKLPPSDWLGFTHEALIKYPKIEAYGKVIDSAVDWAIHHRNKLDDFWRQFNLPDEQTQANSEHSRLMCSELYKLYGFGPKGEVKINKGAFTLNITLGDEDYNNLAEKVGVVMRGSTAFSRSDDGMRIGIFNAKSKVPDANEAHETEHSKNKSLEYSYKWLPLESLPIGDVSKGVARLQEGRYARAQDEIIAMFAGAEAIFPGRREAVEHFRESFPRIMIKNYPVEDEGVTGEEYTENVNSGFKAIFDLLEMYEGVNYDINPARMAINVLAQFPLDKWPAVVRLIKQRKANTSRIRRPMTSEKLGE